MADLNIFIQIELIFFMLLVGSMFYIWRTRKNTTWKEYAFFFMVISGLFTVLMGYQIGWLTFAIVAYYGWNKHKLK